MTDQEKHSINRFLKDWLIKQGVAISWNEYPDYFTWPGFGALWERARESERWDKFVSINGWASVKDLDSEELIYVKLIDPQVFPVEWAVFLGWKEAK